MKPFLNRRVRFSLSSLLFVTALVAGVMRFAHRSSPVLISFDDLELARVPGAVDSKLTPPDTIKAFDQADVRIKGFIHPASVFKAEGIRSFLLCRDNHEPPENLHDGDYVIVRMAGDGETAFVSRPVEVTGRLKILNPPLVGGQQKFYYEIAAVTCD